MSDQSFLAWPFFDDGHRDLVADLERWVADVLPPLLADTGESEADAAYSCVKRLVPALGKSGLLRVCVPKAYGGLRDTLDVRSIAVAREILARSAGLADFALAMQGLGSAPISLYGRDDQKLSILPRIASGTVLGAFALSEPDAGSDVGAIATTATPDGEYWRLNGTKTWISNAGIAGYYVIFARTGEGAGTKGLSAFIVDAETPGLDCSHRIDVIAPHPLGTLRLTDCRVPVHCILGKPGEGFKIAMATLDIFRTTVGAAALGFARRALDEATMWTLKRRVFGKALAEFQLTQSKLGEMAVSIDASALLVYRSAWTKDILGTRVTREASTAKLFATESAQHVIDSAVQLFGGRGVERDAIVERLYREIRALRIYEGTSEVLRLIIGSQVIDAMRHDLAKKR